MSRFLRFAALGTIASLILFDESLSFVWWNSLGHSIIGALEHCLRWMYDDHSAHFSRNDSGLIVSRANLTFFINQACSGFDAWRIFTISFLLLFVIRREMHSDRRWMGIFIMGLPVMFTINLLRISSLVTLGRYMQQSWGAHAAFELLESGAHPYIGMVYYFYTVTIYFFLAQHIEVGYRWLVSGISLFSNGFGLKSFQHAPHYTTPSPAIV